MGGGEGGCADATGGAGVVMVPHGVPKGRGEYHGVIARVSAGAVTVRWNNDSDGGPPGAAPERQTRAWWHPWNGAPLV